MKRKPRITEEIQLTNKGTAIAGKATMDGEVRHFDKDYEVVSDTVDIKGVRILELKPRDLAETKKKTEEIIDSLIKSLGEEESETFKALLKDVLGDFWSESIDDLYDQVILKKKPVKVREGCFKLIVGDGRKKDHGEIMLRD